MLHHDTMRKNACMVVIGTVMPHAVLHAILAVYQHDWMMEHGALKSECKVSGHAEVAVLLLVDCM